jgi:rare lipoprotein A
MEYTVRSGDTIAYVTKVKKSGWRQLPDQTSAVARTPTHGNRLSQKTFASPGPAGKGFAETLRAVEGQVGSGAVASATAPNVAAAKSQAAEQIHQVQKGETIWNLAVNTYQVDPEELMRLNGIKDPRKLQIGQPLVIPEREKKGQKSEVVASWYGKNYHGKTMANGQSFDMHAATIAHKDIPLGTTVLLENPQTGEKATATVTDRGPFIKGRDVDLSYRLAKDLSLEKQGVGKLVMQVL